MGIAVTLVEDSPPEAPRARPASSAVAGAAAQFGWALGTPNAHVATGPDPVRLDWLEYGGPGAAPGSTVGVPWPRGA
jgi:hypothetical protein